MDGVAITSTNYNKSFFSVIGLKININFLSAESHTCAVRALVAALRHRRAPEGKQEDGENVIIQVSVKVLLFLL